MWIICKYFPSDEHYSYTYSQLLEFKNYSYSYLYRSWLRESIPIPIRRKNNYSLITVLHFSYCILTVVGVALQFCWTKISVRLEQIMHFFLFFEIKNLSTILLDLILQQQKKNKKTLTVWAYLTINCLGQRNKQTDRLTKSALGPFSENITLTFVSRPLKFSHQIRLNFFV